MQTKDVVKVDKSVSTKNAEKSKKIESIRKRHQRHLSAGAVKNDSSIRVKSNIEKDNSLGYGNIQSMIENMKKRPKIPPKIPNTGKKTSENENITSIENAKNAKPTSQVENRVKIDPNSTPLVNSFEVLLTKNKHQVDKKGQKISKNGRKNAAKGARCKNVMDQRIAENVACQPKITNFLGKDRIEANLVQKRPEKRKLSSDLIEFENLGENPRTSFKRLCNEFHEGQNQPRR